MNKVFIEKKRKKKLACWLWARDVKGRIKTQRERERELSELKTTRAITLVGLASFHLRCRPRANCVPPAGVELRNILDTCVLRWPLAGRRRTPEALCPFTDWSFFFSGPTFLDKLSRSVGRHRRILPDCLEYFSRKKESVGYSIYRPSQQRSSSYL